MKSIWRFTRIAMAVMGGFLIFGGVSTSDYYVIELEQVPPSHIEQQIIFGILLMIPSVVYAIRKEQKEGKK